MLAYIVRRLLNVVLTVLVVATIVFFIMEILPGDPTGIILGEEASPERMAELREHLGLDAPMAVRFAGWITGLARGDLGVSLFYRRDVTTLIVNRLEPTILLTLLATIIAAVLGVTLGTLAGLFPGSRIDLGAMVLALIGVSMPNFWLGLNLILLFSLYLALLPTSGYDSVGTVGIQALSYLVLPSIALGMSHAGIIARMTRSNIVEVMNQDYVRTARSKGLSESVTIGKHALRNAMIPVASTIGVSIALMLGGSVIVEAVFALPGLGSLVVHSIQSRDLPVIQGVLLLVATFTALINLVVDILYTLLDPRIAYS